MEAVYFGNDGNFALRGTCPYPNCKRSSVFTRVQSATVGQRTGTMGAIIKWVSILQCQGCQKYILGVVEIEQQRAKYTYLEHYPMGAPDDAVAEEIPPGIKENFQEALRCLFVNAYNATAEMCRRAIEGSCIKFGSPRSKKNLEDKIDWLAEQGKITPFLAQVAHKIRLGGNRGAHFPEAARSTELQNAETESENLARDEPSITKEHADAIVKFAREYFHHVYVVPQELEKYDFSKPSNIGDKS